MALGHPQGAPGGPGHCAQHQKLGVKQIVPGTCGGTCAIAGRVSDSQTAHAHSKAIFSGFMAPLTSVARQLKRETVPHTIFN